VPVYGQARSTPQNSAQDSKDKQIEELSRLLDKTQIERDHLVREIQLRDQKEKLDAEAIKLRDDKIDLLDLQLKDAKTAIDELKAAGTADQTQIKAVKEDLRLANKEIKSLKATNWLTGRISIFLIFAAAAIGYFLRGSSN